jgi:hypothetical protein
MSCSCPNQRFAAIHGKVDDKCHIAVDNHFQADYVPHDMNIGGGDYIKFIFCLDCGQIQGKWPLPTTQLETSGDDENDNN